MKSNKHPPLEWVLWQDLLVKTILPNKTCAIKMKHVEANRSEVLIVS